MEYWDHIDRVMRAGTLEEVKAATTAYTRAAGFRHHGYATKLREPLGDGGDFVFFEDFDSDWSKTYPRLATPDSEQTDPRIVLSREGFPAVAWNSRGHTSYEAPRIALALRTRKTLVQAGEFGLHGGITVPSWSPGTQWAFTTFTLQSRLDPRELLPVLGESVYFVSCMHAAMDRLLRRPVGAPRLSAREREVLRWSAIGKTSWEISMILRISERTVNFHLQQVSRKLGVKGRRAACARAVAMGLIVL
ncbi:MULTISPECIES: LuxR C-terminal-related transcriptional regulator [unclassified Lysobacter]|uniref:helix-turn-helix transcriptional regulator n=1 Tax=unclassified Lysobacter TaxID=2635362 RepID=UPI001BEB6489|nr:MULTISPECIES: LuxR C-terminal-related transcriptional regulator [unclassified Lysobacter]MBT2746973.1 autoinducer binding domain-containing protein [Lysobacter sp. ISL-42]MBT2750565.1 autoinducer binding domain-containing protein [Lysobacter sp. ISL-50]MBT2776412.1 autoinducer binding domain-containing protein [Lysobacter sp. ISL-54]MBT2780906.1 autoinducer binding domain-containing protein [Lysobacter sp. ISL-52]